MKTVGAFEAKTKLAELLDFVAKGHSVSITRRGTPVAVLSPAGLKGRRSRTEAIEALQRFEKVKKPEGMSLRDLVEEGRKR